MTPDPLRSDGSGAAEVRRTGGTLDDRTPGADARWRDYRPPAPPASIGNLTAPPPIVRLVTRSGDLADSETRRPPAVPTSGPTTCGRPRSQSSMRPARNAPAPGELIRSGRPSEWPKPGMSIVITRVYCCHAVPDATKRPQALGPRRQQERGRLRICATVGETHSYAVKDAKVRDDLRSFLNDHAATTPHFDRDLAPPRRPFDPHQAETDRCVETGRCGPGRSAALHHHVPVLHALPRLNAEQIMKGVWVAGKGALGADVGTLCPRRHGGCRRTSS